MHAGGQIFWPVFPKRPCATCQLKNESPQGECTLGNTYKQTSASPGSSYTGGLDFLSSLTNSNTFENLIHEWVLARWKGTGFFSLAFLKAKHGCCLLFFLS